MEEMTRSSRARVVGRSSASWRWTYERFEGVVARVMRESWRSFCSWVGESFGRFGDAVDLLLVMMWKASKEGWGSQV